MQIDKLFGVTMFEKEAKEYLGNFADCANCKNRWSDCADSLDEYCLVNDCCYATPKEQDIYIAGAEYGYNKALEEVKHDLMMKLKDEGIVKPLKDSIFRNERLSSQEQQELCAWIECAMDFGENLDKCAKELEEAKKFNEWHYPSKGGYPKEYKDILICFSTEDDMKDCVRGWYEYDFENEKHIFKYLNNLGTQYLTKIVAWKEIVLPKESE